MTASIVKSANITNLESKPRVLVDDRIGNLTVVSDSIDVATTSIDEVDDVILMGPIPSNAVLIDVEVINTLLDSDGVLTFDVGVAHSGTGGESFDINQMSGVEASGDCIGTAVNSLGAANTAYASLRFEAADLDTLDYPLWQLAGLSKDPGSYLFLQFKVVDAATTPVAGKIRFKISYIT